MGGYILFVCSDLCVQPVSQGSMSNRWLVVCLSRLACSLVLLRVEAFNHENSDLKKKVDSLENNNRSLLGQLQKLQALVSKVPRAAAASATQTGTVLMVSPPLCLPASPQHLPPPTPLPSSSPCGTGERLHNPRNCWAYAGRFSIMGLPLISYRSMKNDGFLYSRHPSLFFYFFIFWAV